MTRQETLDSINILLPKQPNAKLVTLLGWPKQEEDAFEQQLRKDVNSGKFDKLIPEVIVKDETGKTLDNVTGDCKNLFVI